MIEFIFILLLPAFQLSFDIPNHLKDPGTSDFEVHIVNVFHGRGQVPVCNRPHSLQKLRHDDHVQVSLKIENITYFAYLNPDYSFASTETLLQAMQPFGLDESDLPYSGNGAIYLNKKNVGDIQLVFYSDGLNGICDGKGVKLDANFRINGKNYEIKYNKNHINGEINNKNHINGEIYNDKSSSNSGMRLFRRSSVFVVNEMIKDNPEFYNRLKKLSVFIYLQNSYIFKFPNNGWVANLFSVIKDANRFLKDMNFAIFVTEIATSSTTKYSTLTASLKDHPQTYSYYLEQLGNTFAFVKTTKKSNFHLFYMFTAYDFGNTVGLAKKEAVCSSIPATGVVKHFDGMGRTLAHEIGHSLGADHDCIEKRYRNEKCGGLKFIMNPHVNDANSFSPRTRYEIFRHFVKQPRTKYTKSLCIDEAFSAHDARCGNGVLEKGEQCDDGDGGSLLCNNDCTFKAGVECTPSSRGLCCNDQGKMRKAGEICRAKIDPCDLEEKCTDTLECPSDRWLSNGQPCAVANSSQNGICAGKQCISRDHQCIGLDYSSSCGTIFGSCTLSCQSTQSSCKSMQMPVHEGLLCGFFSSCHQGKCIYTPDSGIFLLFWQQAGEMKAILLFFGSVTVILVILLAGKTVYSAIIEEIAHKMTEKVYPAMQNHASNSLNRVTSTFSRLRRRETAPKPRDFE